ncbi:hypothetical protein J6S55_00210 [Candidatus Saccharibacteria bacterium]|nr:hypothetical protein [Candidatus Saccharibacteria bacterium]
MDKYIESSIKTRKDAIFNAYEVTDKGMVKKIDDLFSEIEKLGAECGDVSEFETKFAASPLNQKYMDIFTELAQGAATANVAESFAKQAAVGAATNAARGAIMSATGGVVPTSRAAANQKVMDAARSIPGVGEALEVKQYADFFGRFKKKKD